MAADWVWDETLFAGAAGYYEQGRLRYPAALAATLRSALGLDGSGRLLDVGCGPGTVALRVAQLFADVVGLDPDPGMVAEASRLARDRGVANVRFVQARAEELPAELGRFTVATFAQSFHWMDRVRVAEVVGSMLLPGGALVHVDTAGQPSGPAPVLPYPSPPVEAVTAVVRDYLGPQRRAGQSVRETSPSGEAEILRACGYSGPESVDVPDVEVLTRSTDELVADALSRSSSAPHLFGDRLDSFVADLRAVLAEASPADLFSVRPPEVVLKIWRPLT
ncbi:methyltransferase domain-containing protein [Kribbella italica]|uniref:SAM-dependent methyltransferase n=1 Tax=Kribbella italica TaxID=1540520 RepID=A0A7W9MTZ5_9ACTN|nr:SAM-dependent methyltransferase [Kribbella italica]